MREAVAILRVFTASTGKLARLRSMPPDFMSMVSSKICRSSVFRVDQLAGIAIPPQCLTLPGTPKHQ
jgi:hypothetical protein